MTPVQSAITTAWRHIERRTLATATLEAFRACLHDPQVLEAEARLNAVAATGDVLGTQQACQRWNVAWKAALARVQTQQEAA